MNQSQPLPQPGDRIGQYSLIRLIGKGGMALIFEARHELHGARCAIKVMSQTQDNPDLLQRFQREFKALSRLRHPNVLRVIDSGEINGRPFFAMELLDGTVLKDAVEEWAQLPMAQRFEIAEDILIQTCRALDYIHQLGWIHRDVTPSNIMLLKDGSVKLMDFGVVKIPGTELTVAGEVIGTVAYIPPEQVRSEALDTRADLYSLGATLYLMLTGRRPFQARTLAGFLKKHLTERPTPPSEFSPMVPRHLEEACLRLLEKQPDDRFSSANHLLRFLKQEQGIENGLIIGRTAERLRLREAIAYLESIENDPTMTSSSAGGVIILEGESGLGTTRLLQATEQLLSQTKLFWTTNNNKSTVQPIFRGFQSLLEELSENNQVLSEFNADHHLFSRVKDRLLKRLPAVLMMDNIAFADQGTLDLLEYLVHSFAGQPVLFVLNVKDQPNLLDYLLDAPNSELNVSRIRLNPLSISDVEEWLLNTALNSEEIRPLAERIHKESEGNPFIIDQIVRTLQEKELFPTEPNQQVSMKIEQILQSPLPLSPNIQEAIGQRVDAHPVETQTVIQIVSLSSQEVSLSLLSDILEELSARVAYEDLSLRLNALLEDGLITKLDGELSVFYELAHSWFKDVIAIRMSNEAQHRLHRAIGNVIEKQNREHLSTVVENLAYHFEQAGLYGKAYAYLRQAQQKLKQRSMIKESLVFLERAIRIEHHAREHLPLAQAEQIFAELLLERSICEHILGNQNQAQHYAQQADELASQQSNHALLSKIATEKAKQARELYMLAESDLQIQRAYRHAVESGYAKLKIIPLYEQGALYWERGNTDKAEAFFEQALSVSDEIHDPVGRAVVNNGLGVLSMCVGESVKARRYFEESIRASLVVQRIDTLVNARTNLAELLHCMGNFRKALGLVNDTIKYTRDIRHQHGLGVALRYRSMLLTDVGRYVEAKENAEQAYNIQEFLNNPQEQLASIVVWIRALLSEGNWQEAQRLIDQGILVSSDYDAEGHHPILLCWRARLAAKQSNPQLQLLREAADTVGRTWTHQQARCFLNISRAWAEHVELFPQSRQLSVEFAEQALAISDASGYRYYAMRARKILGKLCPNDVERARHLRVSEAIGRSLSATLSTEDSHRFLARNEIKRRI